MDLIRKYIRFYKDNAEEMRLYDALCDHKAYGFLSESDMLKEALRRYVSGGISTMNPDELADMIAKRLQSIMIISSPEAKNIIPKDSVHDNDIYETALSFLDSL